MSAILAMTDVRPATPSTEWSDAITLNVPKGTWTVVRTTPERSHLLARILIGAQAIASGEVVVLGRPIGRVSRDRKSTRLNSSHT